MEPVTAYAIIAAVAFVSSQASAGGPVELTAQEAVNFADLDLPRTGDAERLYDRNRTAAGMACVDPTISPQRLRIIRDFQAYQPCLEKAVDDAVRTVDNANLTAIHEGRATEPASR